MEFLKRNGMGLAAILSVFWVSFWHSRVGSFRVCGKKTMP